MKAFNVPIIKTSDTKELMEHFSRILIKRGKAGHNYFEEIEENVLKKSQ